MKPVLKEIYRLLLDRPYETGVIKAISVTGMAFSGDDFVYIPSAPPDLVNEPPRLSVGDTYVLYGGKFRPIRGLFINGRCVWYLTPGEQRKHLKEQHKGERMSEIVMPKGTSLLQATPAKPDYIFQLFYCPSCGFNWWGIRPRRCRRCGHHRLRVTTVTGLYKKALKARQA